MFSTTNVSDKWNLRGFERMLSYEQYPEEKSPSPLAVLQEYWVDKNLHIVMIFARVVVATGFYM